MNFHRGAFLMVTEKLLKMTSQMLVLIFITRNFNSEDVGSLMYCFALASIFIFINQLGFDSLLQKKFAFNDLMLLSLGYLIEFMVPALFYIYLLKHRKISVFLNFKNIKIYQTIKESFPLLLSGAVIIIYMKVDQILLGYLAGESEVAFYVAGTRLSEAWYFLGLTILAVYYPKCVAFKTSKSFDAFLLQYAKMVRYVICGSLLIILATIFVSDQLIIFLYGTEYLKSSSVLLITIFCVPFVYLGSAFTMVCLELHDQVSNLYRATLGLFASIVLNILLIDNFGAVGSAFASLGAQVVSGFLAVFLVKKSRVELIRFIKIIIGVKGI